MYKIQNLDLTKCSIANKFKISFPFGPVIVKTTVGGADVSRSHSFPVFDFCSSELGNRPR